MKPNAPCKLRRIIRGGPMETTPEPKEWQRRFDAACAIVARKYCGMFEFWRDCRYRPCRSARRCVGDERFCLESGCWDISYDAGLAAHLRMIAELPPDADGFFKTAHHQPPTSRLLHGSRDPKLRAKARAKTVAHVKAIAQAARARERT
ncbi:MAG: hypothetical protein WBF07_10005 [Xanthobacteraceae bacterium]